jgi:hypothetical protein
LSDLPGITAPASYSVRVRPIFAGDIAGEYGPAQCLQTVGNAGMYVWDEEAFTLEERRLNQTDAQIELLVYPNPNAGDVIRVVASNIASSMVRLDVIDALGRVVYSENIPNDGHLQSDIYFNVPLASGCYTVQLFSAEENRKSKLIIRK